MIVKIRNGFVSNSSASSFVVFYLGHELKPDKKGILHSNGIKKSLTKRQVEGLKKRGFRPTWVGHPSRLNEIGYNETNTWMPATNEETGEVIYENLGLCVACNEYDEIRYLVKAQISFIASGHYGHETYLYHKGDDYIMHFRNYGNEVETYCYNKSYKEIIKYIEWKADDPPYRKMPLKEILGAKDTKKVREKISKQKGKKGKNKGKMVKMH